MKLSSRVRSLFVSAVVASAMFSLAPVASAAIVTGTSSTANNGSGGGTSLTINKPSSTAAGDILVANITVDKGASTMVSTPTGWTLIRRTNNDIKVGIASYWKLAGGSEPTSYTWTISPSARAVGGITRYGGVLTTSPIDVTGEAAGQGTTLSSNALSTNYANEVVVDLFSVNDNRTFSTPTGMTEDYDAANPNNSGPATAADEIDQLSAGLVGTSTSPIGNPGRFWASQRIVLRPFIPVENTLALCTDGIDNDFDSIVDLYDADCAAYIPHLTIIWQYVNDNGGSNTSGGGEIAFSSDMSIPGTGHANFYTLGGLNPSIPAGGTTFAISPGWYSASGPGVSNYNRVTSSDCVGTIAAGESKTCTITYDDIAPTLTVIKHVVNNNGGNAVANNFIMNVAGTNVSSSSFSGNESGTTVTLNAGSYSVTEADDHGYSQNLSTNCSGSINIGDTKTCTVVNSELPLIENTLALCTDGIDNDLDGTTDLFDSDCAAYIPHLSIIWQYVNDNGGTQTSGGGEISFSSDTSIPGTGHANFYTLGGLNPSIPAGGTTFAVSPGGYSVSGPGVPNYNQTSSSDCSGSIAAGESKTCTITYNDIAPTLTVIKHVVNSDGGTAVASDFTVSVSGTDVTPTSFSGSETGTLVVLDAGSYSVTDSGPAGYFEAASSGCTGSIGIGQTKTCTLTSSDVELIENSLALCTDGIDNDLDSTTDLFDSDCATYIPHLTIIWQFVNDNGGSQTSGGGEISFSSDTSVPGTGHANFYTLGGLNPSIPAGGTTFAVSPGGYSVSGPGILNYSGTASPDCSSTIAANESKTCTITYNDVAPNLTLVNIVANNNGGTATTTDWTLSATGPTSISGAGGAVSGSTFSAGTYTLSESTGPTGYTASSWTCLGVTNSGNTLNIGIGQSATCTIVNQD